MATSQAFLAALGATSPQGAPAANGCANGLANGTEGAVAEVASAKPYPYRLPLGRTALIMIDFQASRGRRSAVRL